jgi:hypothetical protein
MIVTTVGYGVDAKRASFVSTSQSPSDLARGEQYVISPSTQDSNFGLESSLSFFGVNTMWAAAAGSSAPKKCGLLKQQGAISLCVFAVVSVPSFSI